MTGDGRFARTEIVPRSHPGEQRMNAGSGFVRADKLRHPGGEGNAPRLVSRGWTYRAVHP